MSSMLPRQPKTEIETLYDIHRKGSILNSVFKPILRTRLRIVKSRNFLITPLVLKVALKM